MADLTISIQRMIDETINPQLAYHGGFVALESVTPEGVAQLTMGGGCQGCAGAKMTMKSWIEELLMEQIPSLKGVEDVTDHDLGEEPFFS